MEKRFSVVMVMCLGIVTGLSACNTASTKNTPTVLNQSEQSSSLSGSWSSRKYSAGGALSVDLSPGELGPNFTGTVLLSNSSCP
jgi:hypothetical protein